MDSKPGEAPQNDKQESGSRNSDTRGYVQLSDLLNFQSSNPFVDFETAMAFLSAYINYMHDEKSIGKRGLFIHTIEVESSRIKNPQIFYDFKLERAVLRVPIFPNESDEVSLNRQIQLLCSVSQLIPAFNVRIATETIRILDMTSQQNFLKKFQASDKEPQDGK